MYKPSNHILVIFGASGDLTRRKLIPAMGELQKLELLPEKFAVLGIGRSQFDDRTYREMISGHLENPGEILPLLHYHSMDSESEEAYSGLGRRLRKLSSELQIDPSYLFYLATPPSLYASIPRFLSGAGLTNESDGSLLNNPLERITSRQLA